MSTDMCRVPWSWREATFAEWKDHGHWHVVSVARPQLTNVKESSECVKWYCADNVVQGDDMHEAPGDWSSALCDENTGEPWDPNMVWAGRS